MGSYSNGANLRGYVNVMELDYGVILYKNPFFSYEVCHYWEDCIYTLVYFPQKMLGFL
jgi:hypothetical protein